MKVEYWEENDAEPGGFAEQGVWSLDVWAAAHEVTARELEQIISHLNASGEYIGGDPETGFYKLSATDKSGTIRKGGISSCSAKV